MISKYTPPEFYGNPAYALLETGYSLLDSFYVIPLANPFVATRLSKGSEELSEYMERKDEYAVVRPSSYFRFDVYYDDGLGLGLYAGDNFHNAMEIWVADKDNLAIIGFQRSNQGISAECIVPGIAVSANAVSEYIDYVLKHLPK